jgi:membrane protease YdiL (CAAX protease family)
VLFNRAWAAYLVAAVLGEALLGSFPAATAAIDACVLVAALSQFGWAQRSPLALGDPTVRLLPAVALVPLMRLLSLTMPAPALPPMTWIVLAGAPLLLAVAATARLVALNVREIGLAARPSDGLSLAVMAVSIPVGLGLAQLVPSESVPPMQTPLTSGLVALVLVSCGALPEELIFRGVLQPLVVRQTGRIGIVLVALVHAATYAGTGSLLVVGLMAVIGFLYGSEVARTGSLWTPLVGHSLIAVCATVVAPLLAGLPDSG